MIATQVPENLQGFFDNAVQHVREGNPQCQGHDGECKYRDGQGNACLIGVSIPDRLYDPKLEGADPLNTVRMDPLLGHLKYNERHALKELQELHDLTDFTDYKTEMLSLLQEFATRHGLLFPED